MDQYVTRIGHQLAWLDHHHHMPAIHVYNAWRIYVNQFPGKSKKDEVATAYTRAYTATTWKLRRLT